MKVVILDDNLNAVRKLSSFELLRGHEVDIVHEHFANIHALVARAAGAQVLVLNRERTQVSRALIEGLTELRLISQTGQSIPHIDLAACTQHGVVVCAGGRAPLTTVELTWALILAARRRVFSEALSLRQGSWQTSLGTTVRGRILGIYGYGTIGSEVARIAPGFGMQVLAWGRDRSVARAKLDGVEVAKSKSDLFEQSDVLSLHVKLTDETRRLVRASDLARMKPSSLIVNTSRAALFEDGALVNALAAGRPGFAAVDVFEHEPITDAKHPLLRMDNVLCTPHIGHVEADAYEHFYRVAFEQIVAFAAGEPKNVSNPDVLTHLSMS